MLTLRHTIGIVSLLAAIMACIAATIGPPSSTTEFSGGLLFALTIALCAVAIARVISALPQIDRFWAAFLFACITCFAISFSSATLASNTAPEHITRYIVRLRPLDGNVPVHKSNERFYAMQRVVTNAGVLLLAVVCGVLAQQRKIEPPNETKHDG